MSTLRRRTIELLLAGCLCGGPAGAETRTAPNEGAPPADQLRLSGNACGPAALLSSFRSGSPAWQRAAASLPGTNDRQQLGLWIRRHGLQPSATLKGRKRWTSAGINVEDLVAAANETTRPLYLPPVAADDLFLRRGEKPEALLRRARDRFDRSLAKGIPPLLSVRRFVLRAGVWTPLEGHFITITAVPRQLARGETSFPIRYLDPWGGKRAEGRLGLPPQSLLAAPGQPAPCLQATLPAANVGKNQVRRGEATALIPASVIGRW
jgi:hypothetical protein